MLGQCLRGYCVDQQSNPGEMFIFLLHLSYGAKMKTSQHSKGCHKRLCVYLLVSCLSKNTYIWEPFWFLNFHSTRGLEPKSAEYEHVRSAPEMTESTLHPEWRHDCTATVLWNIKKDGTQQLLYAQNFWDFHDSPLFSSTRTFALSVLTVKPLTPGRTESTRKHLMIWSGIICCHFNTSF